MSSNTKTNAELIECTACNHKVSVMAESCTSCGNPINWVHPKIQEFYDSKDSGFCKKEISFIHEKYIVTGETEPRLSIVEKIFAIIGFLSFIIFCASLPIFIALIGGLLVGAAYTLYRVYFGKKDTFEVDLLNKKWLSSDDDLFVNVRDFFFDDSFNIKNVAESKA